MGMAITITYLKASALGCISAPARDAGEKELCNVERLRSFGSVENAAPNMIMPYGPAQPATSSKGQVTALCNRLGCCRP
jgi:hypothetical protein